MTAVTAPTARHGSIGAGVAWMSGLTLLLFWLPMLGPFIAGYVGGTKAGSVWRAVVAAVLPALILTLLVGYFSAALSGMPLVGFLAGFGSLILIAGNIGALLGGFMA